MWNIILPHSLVIPNSTSRHLYYRSKSICLHKELYMNVHSNIIHNSSKLETIQMPMNFKVWCSRIIKCYSTIIKEQNTDICYSMNEPQKHYPKWKKPHSHKNLYPTWFHLSEMSRKGKFIETDNESWLSGFGDWIRIECKQTQGNFWSDENGVKLSCGDGCQLYKFIKII